MIALVRASIVNQLLGTVQVDILDLVIVLGKAADLMSLEWWLWDF